MLNDGSLMEQRMQDSLNSIPDNEINLREVLITLWVYKLLIIITCVLGFVTSLNYSKNMVSQFKSTATFKLDQGNTNAFSFSGFVSWRL